MTTKEEQYIQPKPKILSKQVLQEELPIVGVVGDEALASFTIFTRLKSRLQN